MALEQLTEQEQRVIQQSINAILNGPSLDDAEFETRLGLDRSRLQEVLAAWPQLEDADDDSDASIAINNCLNEVLHGVYVSPKEWVKWFTVSEEDVKMVYEHWAQLKSYVSTGIR